MISQITRRDLSEVIIFFSLMQMNHTYMYTKKNRNRDHNGAATQRAIVNSNSTVVGSISIHGKELLTLGYTKHVAEFRHVTKS